MELWLDWYGYNCAQARKTISIQQFVIHLRCSDSQQIYMLHCCNIIL